MVIYGDLIDEDDEAFTVELRAFNEEDTISTQTFRVTILNDGDSKIIIIIIIDSYSGASEKRTLQDIASVPCREVVPISEVVFY